MCSLICFVEASPTSANRLQVWVNPLAFSLISSHFSFADTSRACLYLKGSQAHQLLSSFHFCGI